MPSFKMGGNTSESKKKFENQNGKAYLLIDLDGPDSTKSKRLNDYSKEKRECVFFIIQEMEAWFLSQPEVLEAYFNPNQKQPANLSYLRNQNPTQIVEPEKALSCLVRKHFKRNYHKVNDGMRLLANLNAKQLMQSFPEFNRLITTLQA